jgi:hypothetical protein
MRPCWSTNTRELALIPPSEIVMSNESSSTTIQVTAGVRSMDGAIMRASLTYVVSSPTSN